MKQIPNLFTLLNLVFGCIAIVLTLQTGETIVLLDQYGATQVDLPERITWAALFIFGAAVIDFLDGFLARLMNAHSEMGKQLDSLSDVVSFGVAPGMILYQLLRISFAQEEYGLDVPFLYLMPAFLFTCAVAWRLAKFNISTTQKYHFEGVPSPAAGLFVASLPLIIWYRYFEVQEVFINKWLLFAIIIILSYLMVSRHSFMAMKFSDYTVKNNKLKFILILIAILSVVFLRWMAVPVIFIAYVLISFFEKEPAHTHINDNKQLTDITV